MSQMISSARTQCTVHRKTCLPWQADSQRKACWHARQARPTAACRAAFGTVAPGRGRRATRAAAEKFPAEGTAIGTMFRPPGPAHLYPEVEKGFEELLKSAEALEAQAIQEALNARYAEGNPYLERLDRANDWLNTIESPPEWGRPDEGNPNQPRRPPEYQPPQEPVPGIGKPLPEFDPPERSPTSPPMPQDDPMRPLPPEQPEIPPNERNPLRRAPDEIPGKDEPNERPGEQTQPRPGEVSASPDTANMRSILNDEEMEMLVWALLDKSNANPPAAPHAAKVLTRC